jgi:5,10-methylenetetrahydromethanopterin reductase
MRISTFLTPAMSASATVDAVAAASDADGVWIGQIPGMWDPLAVLAAVGPDAGPAELGVGVAVTYPRHPAVMAAEALTVSSLTGGRLTLGVGPGHAWFVTEQLGLPYSSPAAYTREYLNVLRPLLRGEHVVHDGTHFTVDTKLDVTGPPPAVLISALGPRMLAVARDLADGTITTWTRWDSIARDVVPALGDGARVVSMVPVAVTDQPDEVREAVARNFGGATSMPAYRAAFDRGGISGPADTVVAGPAKDVRRELARYRDAGVTDLAVLHLGDPAAALAVAHSL